MVTRHNLYFSHRFMIMFMLVLRGVPSVAGGGLTLSACYSTSDSKASSQSSVPPPPPPAYSEFSP